jgi:hypothetical protein
MIIRSSSVLVGAVILMAGCNGSEPPPAAPPPAPAPLPARDLGDILETVEPADNLCPEGTIVRGRDGKAVDTTCVFVLSYLRHSYDEGLHDVPMARTTPKLKRYFLRQPIRVRGSASVSRPRLLYVDTGSGTGGKTKIAVTAGVDDGEREYDVRMTLVRRNGKWLVDAVR